MQGFGPYCSKFIPNSSLGFLVKEVIRVKKKFAVECDVLVVMTSGTWKFQRNLLPVSSGPKKQQVEMFASSSLSVCPTPLLLEILSPASPANF
jgi:hypothetical protein